MGENILVVEDDEVSREMLCQVLEHHGYSCTGAVSAVDARRFLQEIDFVLAVLDINLPGESGLDLARFIRDEHLDVGLVMVTGEDDPEVANAALEVGAYGYVFKPFEPNQLLINVYGALRRHREEMRSRTHLEMLEAELLAQSAALNQAKDRLKNLEEGGSQSPTEGPDDNAKAERRSVFRLSIPANRGVRASLGYRNTSIPARALNISLKGILLKLPQDFELPPGTRVVVKVEMDHHQFQFPALVRRKEGRNYGFFVPEDPHRSASRSLRAIVTTLQREWLRQRRAIGAK